MSVSRGRYAVLILLLGSLAFVCRFSEREGLTAPAPRVPADRPPVIEKDGFRLEIRAIRDQIKYGAAARRDDWSVTLVLLNKMNRPREAKFMNGWGNRVASAQAVHFMFRFADGTVFEPEQYYTLYDDEGGRLLGLDWAPFAVPANGGLQDVYNLWPPVSDNVFAILFEKNGGRFCMTALVPLVGMQSNTLRYNGCPAPPETYKPLTHSSHTPEALAKQEEKNRREQEEIERKEAIEREGFRRD